MQQLTLKKEDIYHGSLILVAPNHPVRWVPQSCELSSVAVRKPKVLLKSQAAIPLNHLLSGLRSKRNIVAVSGFRTRAQQWDIWDTSLEKSGFAFTQKFVAVPGHSEHETGLAIDLAENKADIDFVCPDFPRTGIFKKFRQAAPHFGFVERYQAGKEAITGIGAEPWHWRYVGFPHSLIMAKKGMVLEEYLHFLKVASCWKRPYIIRTDRNVFELSYIPMENLREKKISIPKSVPYTISGTNEGGVVICLWRSCYAN